MEHIFQYREYAVFIVFYLIGTFPSGYLIAKLCNVDIYRTGSGNIGATNIARSLGKGAGISTLLFDIIKGFLVVSISKIFFTSDIAGILSGFTCILGHCFSLPPLLKGGKGIATTLGVFLSFSPPIALSLLLVFTSVFFITRVVSFSSLASAFALPIIGVFLRFDNQVIYVLIMISLLVIIRHQANIYRILSGQEEKFSFSRKI